MSAPEVNVPLLRKAVEWAEAEAAKPHAEGRWLQQHYILDPTRGFDMRVLAQHGKATDCGTCYCVAGYVSSLSSDERAGIAWQAREVATEDLGIADDAAADLFCASNSIEDVRRIAEEIAGERL